MNLSEFNKIVKHFFHNRTIDEIETEEIDLFIQNNPLNYLGVLFKLAKQKITQNREILISSYFYNSLWIEHLLESLNKKEKEYEALIDLKNIDKIKNIKKSDEPTYATTLPLEHPKVLKQENNAVVENEKSEEKIVKVEEEIQIASQEVIEDKPAKKVATKAQTTPKKTTPKKSTSTKKPRKRKVSSKTIHAPLYTEDYFATQGEQISSQVQDGEWLAGTKVKSKNTQEDIDQIKDSTMSFTSWLQAISHQEHTQTLDSISLADNAEVITISMAQVYEKQGQIDKAIGIYEKIIRQNPEMEVSLTKKINQLKLH